MQTRVTPSFFLFASLGFLFSLPTTAASQQSVVKSPFGKTPDGKAVYLYTLTNKNGLKAKIMTYGAIVTQLWVPDKNGQSGDIVCGCGRPAARAAAPGTVERGSSAGAAAGAQIGGGGRVPRG